MFNCVLRSSWTDSVTQSDILRRIFKLSCPTIDQKAGLAGAASPCWTKSILREDWTDSPARRQYQSVREGFQSETFTAPSSGRSYLISHYITPHNNISDVTMSHSVTVSKWLCPTFSTEKPGVALDVRLFVDTRGKS